MAPDESANSRAAADERSELANENQMRSEFAKALQELTRGENTATALEARLDDIESRIDQLLASVEENGRQKNGVLEVSDKTSQSEQESQAK